MKYLIEAEVTAKSADGVLAQTSITYSAEERYLMTFESSQKVLCSVVENAIPWDMYTKELVALELRVFLRKSSPEEESPTKE